jgi:hypothetical protein
MAKRIQIAIVNLLILFFASTAIAQEPTSPVLVARFHQSHVIASIPMTTVYTPAYTGVYRASVYVTATTLATTVGWIASWNWYDDAGMEEAYVAQTASENPPYAYGYAPDGLDPSVPLTFEAVAGQPMSFSLTEEGTGGACSLAIIVEKLE